MADLRLIPFGGPEYRAMVRLREQVLRQPLGLVFSPSELLREQEDLLLACFTDEGQGPELAGCCILSPQKEGQIRLRQMAVRSSLRGRGLGRSLLAFAEETARLRNFQLLNLHARQEALGFYLRQGYELRGFPFLELGIPHREMLKDLVIQVPLPNL